MLDEYASLAAPSTLHMTPSFRHLPLSHPVEPTDISIASAHNKPIRRGNAIIGAGDAIARMSHSGQEAPDVLPEYGRTRRVLFHWVFTNMSFGKAVCSTKYARWWSVTDFVIGLTDW
jgi:hypothetical protein